MKFPLVLVSIAAAMTAFSVPVQAQTACAASAGIVQLTGAQITELLTGRTVCGLPGPGYPGSAGDRFQEEHMANGDLFDYKRGPGHPIDPRERVGSWVVNPGGGIAGEPAGVTHRYASIQFTWSVFGPVPNVAGTSVYSFCSGTAEHVRAVVIPTASGCATFPSATNASARLASKVTPPDRQQQ